MATQRGFPHEIRPGPDGRRLVFLGRDTVGSPIDFTPEEAEAAIDRAKYTFEADGVIRMELDGRSLRLCRVDLLHQVPGWISWSTDPLFNADPVASYRRSIMYGARIEGDAFFVIDSTTDG